MRVELLERRADRTRLFVLAKHKPEYVQPNIPVSGSASAGGRWSGLYGQVRGEWAITPNLAGAVEVVRYWVGNVIRRAGGHDSQYVSVQLQFGW